MARDRITAHLYPSESSNPSNNSTEQISSKVLATSLLQECSSLLDELNTLQSHLSSIQKPNIIELRQFKNVVQSELKSLDKLREHSQRLTTEKAVYEAVHANDDLSVSDRIVELEEAESRLLHSLRSSNLPFYVAVWRIAKSMCTDLVAFSKRFYWYDETKFQDKSGGDRGDQASEMIHNGKGDYSEDSEARFHKLEVTTDDTTSDSKKVPRLHSQKKSVLVDIVADNGGEWVKVSTVTPNRLLFELAKMGWETDWDSAPEDDEQNENFRLQNDDSDAEHDTIELIKLAGDMKKAAALVRVRYKHPRIRFILPKITEGETPEVDRIIKEIRKTGVMVECGNHTIEDKTPVQKPDIPGFLKNIPLSLIPKPDSYMTTTLNVDCTLLLALVSDLSHIRNLSQSPSQHRAIRRQIEMEAKKALVSTELWPIMGDRELICTKEASGRMHEIVDIIGTATEKERTKILMGETDTDRNSLITKFQQLSDHHVPLTWKLPVKVVDSQAQIDHGLSHGHLPRIAHKVLHEISDINKSVFLYGWATGLTTISSNRTVAKQIETIVEENRGSDDEVSGPDVWLCETARSLVGKEHGRRS